MAQLTPDQVTALVSATQGIALPADAARTSATIATSSLSAVETAAAWCGSFFDTEPAQFPATLERLAGSTR
jgi:hypothetical protein